MAIFRSVLCGIDGSNASLHACDEVMDRMQPGQTVTAVAVMAQEPFSYDATVEALDRLDAELAGQREELTRVLDGVAASGKEKGLSVDARFVQEGQPYEQLLAQADGADSSVVVLGVGRKGHLQRRLVGSTVSRVIGFGDRDVLLVPESVSFGEGPVLVPVDGSKQAKRALGWAEAYAESKGCALMVLAVADAPTGKEGEPLSQLGSELLSDAARTRAEEAAAMVKKVDATVLVRSGEAAAEIVLAARENGAGLIVMGSHGRTGIKHMLMGSTTERTVEAAPCPVLVAK